MKRSLCLMLVLFMLFSSCSNQPVETQSGEESAPAETLPVVESVPEETAPEETLPAPDLPDVSFDGENLNVLTRVGSWAYDVGDVFREDLTGEVWNDAIYNRNIQLEEAYKVELKEHPFSEPSAAFQSDFLGGLHTYDLVIEQMMEMMPLALKNFCLDWNELTYVNTEDPWFDACIKRDLSVAGKLYAMAGAVSIQPSFVSRCLFFSKGIMEDYNIEPPYDLVRDGKWTIDRMIEMVGMVHVDKNGDGAYNASDILGLLKETPDFFLIGAGVLYTGMDENGIPVPSINNEHTIAAIDKVRELLNIPNCTIHYVDAAAGKDTTGYPHLYSYMRSVYFADEHFLFTQTDPSATAEFIDMERGFGVLPNPKLDEEQEAYYHMVDQWSCAWFIPSDTLVSEKTDLLFTAWNYFSLPVVDAYYEKTLKLKRADAPEDSEMLDIVRQNTRYEISLILDLGIASIVESAYQSGNFASAYARKIKTVEKLIDTKFGHLAD